MKRLLVLCSVLIACCILTPAQENLIDICETADNVFDNGTGQRVVAKSVKYRGENIVMNNDRLVTGVEEVSKLGCIGFRTGVKISIRSRLKYQNNEYPLNTYESGFFTLKFRDKKDGVIIKTVSVTSGDEIEWLPATYAEVSFKFPAGISYGSDRNLLRPNRLQGSTIIAYVYGSIPSEE